VSAATRWLVLIVASTAAAVGAADVASGTALTTVPILWFLAVCPGMPYAWFVVPAGDDPLRRWLTAVGLSIALAAVVAEALLLAEAFTGFTAISVLGAIAVIGAIGGLVAERAAARRAAETPVATTAAE
jgi:hypothetical protein